MSNTSAGAGRTVGRVRGRAIAVSIVAVLAALAILPLVLQRNDGGNDRSPASRDDPIADLLAWVPANPTTRAAFAVWTPDSGVATATPSDAMLELADRLGLDPAPRGIGRSAAWNERYGWNATQVASWVTAGESGDLTVLDGRFDPVVVRRRLQALGYARATYRDVEIHVLRDSADGIGGVAMLDGRLIVGASDVLVRQAIDTALADEGSLADEPSIAASLRSMQPLSGLVAVDQVRLAALCAPQRIAGGQPLSGRYALVGYGRVGAGGERRTMIAASFPDNDSAAAALPSYERGWSAGFAVVGNLGGPIDALGDLGVVSQSGSLLIAEMVNGRDDGWVRSAIRFATPVCEVAMAVSGVASPAAVETRSLSTMARLAAALPEIGDSGRLMAADFGSIEAARSVSPPESGALDGWLEAMAPLPAFTVAPVSSAALNGWSEAFGAPVSAIQGIAEARAEIDSAAVGVVIGSWRLDEVTTNLVAQGYDWVDLGDVRHFAPRRSLASQPALMSVAGAVWENIAVRDNAIWFSGDQRELRAVVDAVTARRSGDADAGSSRRFLEAVAGATAVDVRGAGDVSGRGCGLLPGLAAIGAAWTASAGGESAAIVYVPDGTVPESRLIRQLESRVSDLALSTAAVISGTPIRTGPARLIEVMDYLGTEPASTPAGGVIVARFAVPDRRPDAEVGFFGSTTGACALIPVG